jgi:hypothetical protein
MEIKSNDFALAVSALKNQYKTSTSLQALSSLIRDVSFFKKLSTEDLLAVV